MLDLEVTNLGFAHKRTGERAPKERAHAAKHVMETVENLIHQVVVSVKGHG
jgi:hypothetical protein